MAQFTDEEVKQFITANMNNPLAIANAAKQYGYTAQQLSQITGYSLPDIYNYFKNANIQFWDQEVGPQPTVAQPVTQQAYQLGTTPPPSGIATLTTTPQALYVQGPGQANVTGGAGPEPITTPAPLGTDFDPRVADYSYTLTQEQDPRVKDAIGDDYQINELLGITGSNWAGQQYNYQALDPQGNPTGQFTVEDLGNRQILSDLASYAATAAGTGAFGQTGRALGSLYQAGVAADQGNLAQAIAAAVPGVSYFAPGLREYAGIGNTIAGGARLYSAIENKDILGALTQGLALAGVDKLGDTGLRRGDIGLAGRVLSSIQSGNIGGAITALSDIASRADLPGAEQGRMTGRALELIQALESGNPLNVLRATTRFGNAAKELQEYYKNEAYADEAVEAERLGNVRQVVENLGQEYSYDPRDISERASGPNARGTDEEYAGLDFGVNYGARGTDEEYAGLGPSISQEELLAILGSTAQPEGDVTITSQKDIIDELGGFVEPGMWNTGQVVDVTGRRDPAVIEAEDTGGTRGVVTTPGTNTTYVTPDVPITDTVLRDDDTLVGSDGNDDLPPVSRPIDPTFPEQVVPVERPRDPPDPELPQPPPLEPPVVEPPIPEVVVNPPTQPPTQPPVQPPPKKPPEEEPALPNLSWRQAQAAADALGMPQLANVFYFGTLDDPTDPSASVTDFQGQQEKLAEAVGGEEEGTDRATDTRNALSRITAQLEKIFPGEDFSTDMDDILNILRG